MESREVFPEDIFILEIWQGILEAISRMSVNNGLEFYRKIKVKAGDGLGSHEARKRLREHAF